MKRAQTHLLEHLYSHINSMANAEGDGLLDEDPQTAQRRAAGKASLQVSCGQSLQSRGTAWCLKCIACKQG